MKDESSEQRVSDQIRKRLEETPHPSEIHSGRSTRVEINLDNLVHNYQVMKAHLGAGVHIMPAVKADAYGHGAVECALTLEQAGAEWFGVALVEEAAALRDAGVSKPILCLGGFSEGQEQLLFDLSLTPALSRLALLGRLNDAADREGVTASYHLKIDTGMGRLGVPFDELDTFLSGAARLARVRMDGVMTHFASADAVEGELFTRGQMEKFESAIGKVRRAGFDPAWVHQSNSAVSHSHPGLGGNLVRLGGVLYGLWRDVTNPTAEPLDWRPVMSLRTSIVLLKTVPAGTPLGYGGTFVTERESRIATLAIGYADGFRRALSNRGQVLVRGQFAPVVGRISMDLTIIDVTDVTGVEVGDEVVLIGRQGNSSITAEAVAEKIETISYEVTCGISARVPRIYSRGR
jgi:alanine racemase